MEYEYVSTFSNEKYNGEPMSLIDNTGYQNEKALWIKVLLLFLEDMSSDYKSYSNSSNGDKHRLKYIIDSHKYSLNTQWIKQICCMADKEHGIFVSTALKILSGELDLKKTMKECRNA